MLTLSRPPALVPWPPTSCSRRAARNINRNRMDLSKGEQKTSEYMKIHR